MRPFFFGRSQRPLFGMHHPAAGRPGAAAAVLLCNPFGHEAVRAHRIYRVLAGKLSRLGIHVLRFDYYGTGDSSGDSADGTPAQWIDDILDASDELASLAGASRVAWVGLRYGATLAALAAEKAATEVNDLVLWDPVVRGAAYLDELVLAHAAFMRDDLESWRPAAPPATELLGFPLTPALRRAFDELDLTARRPVRARRITVVSSRRDDDGGGLRASIGSWGAPARWLVVESASPWNTDEAMNASLVPIEIVDAVVDCVRGA